MNNIFWAKKLIGAALAAGMACTALGGFGTLTASAVAVNVDGCIYEISDGESGGATLVKANPDATGMAVPGEIRTEDGDVVPVTAIGEMAFARTALQTVRFPASVKKIGPSAFRECTSLALVEFEPGSQLADIGDGAFSGCTALQSVALPASARIAKDAFAKTVSLTKVGASLSETEERAVSAKGSTTKTDAPVSVQKRPVPVQKQFVIRVLNMVEQSTGCRTTIKPSTVIRIVSMAKNIFEYEPTLVKLDKRRYVVQGDIHGSLPDALACGELMKAYPETTTLFLGDYVDKGANSFLTIMYLFAMKILNSHTMFMLRGNHESPYLNRKDGFFNELRQLFPHDFIKIFNAFNEAFSYLPLAAILNGKVFCVHGGISPHFKQLEDLETFNREEAADTNPLVIDLCWSDPLPRSKGFSKNGRGFGCYFGQDVLDEFLRFNHLEVLVRAHEVVPMGVCQTLTNCFTVFSSSNYDGHGNKAGYLIIDETCAITECMR